MHEWSKHPLKLSHSPAETKKLAADLAQTLSIPTTLFLKGGLGAGKTTFVKGLAEGLKIDPNLVHSPSFGLIHEYPGQIPLFHCDLYRLNHEREIAELGLEEYQERSGILVIEWPERIPEIDQWQGLWVELEILASHTRQLTLKQTDHEAL